MFNALPLSTPNAAAVLAPGHNLLTSVTTAGPAPNSGNDFARALDRAQDRQKPFGPQPSATSTANDTTPPPPHAPQHKAATKSPSNTQAANNAKNATRDPSREASNPKSTDQSTDHSTVSSSESSTPATRRTTRARSAASDGQTELAASTMAAAIAAAAIAATQSDKALAGRAAKVGGLDTTLASLGLRDAEPLEHAPMLLQGGVVDAMGRHTNTQPGPSDPSDPSDPSGTSGPGGGVDIVKATGVTPGIPIDADLGANADPGLALNTQIMADGKIVATDGDQTGGALPALRITGPVSEFKIAPHRVDSLGTLAPSSASALGASAGAAASGATSLATEATTLPATPTVSTAATNPAANPTTTLTAAPAGGWRFVQERREPNATDPFRPAALPELGSVIGAMNGLAPEVRSRQGFSPFDPAPLTRPTSAPAKATVSAESNTLNSLAALLSSAEGLNTSASAADAPAAPSPSALAIPQTTAADGQRGAKVQGAGQRHDPALGDVSARPPVTAAEAVLPALAARVGMLGEQGAPVVPGFAASLAAQSANSASPVETSLIARPTSAEFSAEFGQKVTLLVMNGVQTAKLHLNPAEMGPVTVQIQLEGAAAQVHLVAENVDTRQALQESMPQLASQLRESGLTLTGGGVFEQPRQTPQEPPKDQPARQPAARERTGDSASDTSQAQNLRASGPAGATSRRGLVDLVA